MKKNFLFELSYLRPIVEICEIYAESGFAASLENPSEDPDNPEI